MTTPYGKAVKKLRIDAGLKLKDMADGLDVRPSYLSAVENGRKRITGSLVEKTVSWLLKNVATELSPKIAELKHLVDISQPDLRVDLTRYDDGQRELLVAFTRKFEDLSSSQVAREHLEQLLESIDEEDAM